MSETGQPGAATPGEHGDGTGPQDDLARSGSGWAPQAAGWPRRGEVSGPREPAPPWGSPDPASGWAASSARHGDLPPPLPGPASAEPPARVNGHRVNGVDHPGDDVPTDRRTPVSAPPGAGEQRRDPGNDRLVVPAQRPAPVTEQPPGQQPTFGDPESGPPRYASDDPRTGRETRWSDPGRPTSAPPAVQVPPVGTAASGFEVPPGLHAPSADRPAAEESASAAHPPRGWGDSFPPEPPATDPRSVPPAAERPVAERPGEPAPGGDRLAGVDRTLDRAFRDDLGPDPATAGPDRASGEFGPDRAPGEFGPDRAAGEFGPDRASGEFGQDRAPGGPRADRAPGGYGQDRGPGGDRSPEVDSAAAMERAPGIAREPSPDPEPDTSRPPARWPAASEPDRAAPSWNRPSWGASAWAPPWSREETETPGRRSREEPEAGSRRSREEPGSSVGPRSRDREEAEPVARRSREEQAPPWAAEPPRPYDPPRAEATPPYDSPRAEPARPYEAPPAGSTARPPYERPAAPADRATAPTAEPAAPSPAERPAWAGGAPAAPASAPPLAYAPATGPAARAEDTPERASRPFRLRPESGETPPRSPGGPSTGPGPAVEAATGGAGRRDHIPSAPAPTSAPPYAARRSAPEPAQPAAADRTSEPTAAVLPQRVPAEPDVPVVPEPPTVEPPAETPELARIATHLRRDDEPAPLRERPEGFDVNAILDAVRGVAGVRDAALRRTPAGAHSLRLDLADGADPAEVSRQVARLLQERMGLAAAPQNVPGVPTEPAPPVRRRSADPRGAGTRSPGGIGPRVAEPRGTGPAPAETRVPGSRVPSGPPEAPQARVEQRSEPVPETPRRRRQPVAPHRGRAAVEEPGSVSGAPTGLAGGPTTGGTSYTGGQVTTTETAPSRPLDTGGAVGPRVVIDHVQVSTFGLDATVEVRLLAGGESAAGYSTGPAVDGYLLRLCAVAAAAAVDELLRGGDPGSDRGRCFVEHAAVVPFGNCDVATVVVLLVCDGWVEQLVGSALVAGDPRQAVVRATLAAVNRRIEALLA